MHLLFLVFFQNFPNDSGPIYKETIAGRLIVEPYNTFSNLIFLIVLWYWGIRVYKNPRQHQFLALVLPIIAISYVGGTIYHATRSHEFWLLLDWVPIMLLCLIMVIYFIFKIVAKWWQRVLFIAILFGASYMLRILPMQEVVRISIGYIITALTIMVPLVWYLSKTTFTNMRWVVFAFLVFAIAIYFRSIDLTQTIFPMGTHWLWHFFGGVAVHFLITYIFKDNLLNLSANSAYDHD
ncbi:ceramidase [Flagellimonas sp. CMM7]|uniref:ceramidase n=1 Tax=Flagellimonas sp. CMM7 TaxID=2654676 RepID=UPI001F1A5D6A|nr:ceramidase [Flagellimonas sp. CMM7]UII81767.1 ceramidase [Flagellimonas sp. CMM7]